METIREILAAHSSGISKPGLLAWARLRIDTAMTDAQLDEELARLGDEVVDDGGFLYLRSARNQALLSPWAPAADASQGFKATLQDARRSFESAPRNTEARSPLQAARLGRGGIGKVIGVIVVVLWIGGFFGNVVERFVGGSSGAETPVPTAAATPTYGSVVSWDEIAVGDCLVIPAEDEFSDVRRIPCDTPHGGEVFHVVDYPNATTETTPFPTVEALQALVDITCKPAFASWTGTSVDDQDLLEIGVFSPTEEGWSAGGREVECYLYLVDGSLAEQSYRGSNP